MQKKSVRAVVTIAAVMALVAVLSGCAAVSIAPASYSKFPAKSSFDGYKLVSSADAFKLAVNANNFFLTPTNFGDANFSAEAYSLSVGSYFGEDFYKPWDDILDPDQTLGAGSYLNAQVSSFAKPDSGGAFAIPDASHTGLLYVDVAETGDSSWPWTSASKLAEAVALEKEMLGPGAKRVNATSFSTPTKYVGLIDTGMIYAQYDVASKNSPAMADVASEVARRSDSLNQPLRQPSGGKCTAEEANGIFAELNGGHGEPTNDGAFTQSALFGENVGVVCEANELVSFGGAPEQASIAIVLSTDKFPTVLAKALGNAYKEDSSYADSGSWSWVSGKKTVELKKLGGGGALGLKNGITYPGTEKTYWGFEYFPLGHN